MTETRAAHASDDYFLKEKWDQRAILSRIQQTEPIRSIKLFGCHFAQLEYRLQTTTVDLNTSG